MKQSKDWEDGFNEGYIQGQQNLLHNIMEMFLNSEEANEFSMNGFTIKKSGIKKKKSDKIKNEQYANSSWDFKRKF